MANMTTTVNKYNEFGAVGYVMFGSVSCMSNLCIALSIAKYGALRRLNQYVLLMALAIADATTMFGYVAAGSYRLWLIAFPTTTRLTPISCLLKPQSLIFLFSAKLAHLMLLVIGVDRLLLVAAPNFYLLSLPSPGYAKSLVLGAFAFTSSMGLICVGAVLAKPHQPTESAYCFFPSFYKSSSIWSRIYVFYNVNVSSVFALSSVLIFAAVLPVYKWSNNTTTSVPAEQRAELKRQREMTKSLAVSATCTLLLLCIPYKFMWVARDEGHYLLGWMLTHLTLLNPCANLIIYQLRHHEMRVALQGLFKFKQMPQMLSLWPKPTNLVHTVPPSHAP